MTRKLKKKFLLFAALLCLAGTGRMLAQASPSPLHVDGPFLVNAEGRRVNLHGFAQTFSPWFNEQGTKWTNYDVNGCLAYNKGIIDGIMNGGWKMTFVRQHMDPYWSNTPGKQTKVIIDLHQMPAYKDDACTQIDHYVDASHIYIAGFWTTGSAPIYIKDVFLSNDGINPTESDRDSRVRDWSLRRSRPRVLHT